MKRIYLKKNQREIMRATPNTYGTFTNLILFCFVRKY